MDRILRIDVQSYPDGGMVAVFLYENGKRKIYNLSPSSFARLWRLRQVVPWAFPSLGVYIWVF